MSQHVQELIDKIKQEGVQAGEEKASEIETEARSQADKIISEAKQEAEKLVSSARDEIKKLQESTHASLQQAARDTILSLHQEIERTLQKIVQKDVGGALTGDQLAQILTEVVKEFLKGNQSELDIVVAVNKKDLEALEKGFLTKIQEQIKQSIKLQASDDISSGFTISYDSGKSCFDFSDASLAQFLGSFVNVQISALIKETV